MTTAGWGFMPTSYEILLTSYGYEDTGHLLLLLWQQNLALL